MTKNATASPELIGNQKRWVDLIRIPPQEKNFRSAQAEIRNIERLPGWRKPSLIPVRNITDQSVVFNDISLAPGEVTAVFEWDLAALTRFLARITRKEAAAAPEPTAPPRARKNPARDQLKAYLASEPEPDPGPVAIPEPEPPAPVQQIRLAIISSIAAVNGLIADMAGNNREFAELNRLASAAQEELRRAASLDIPLAEARRKINEANLTLNLVAARRDKFSEPQAALLEKLCLEVRSLSAAWDSAIQAAQQNIERKIFTDAAFLFGGSQAEAKRYWKNRDMHSLPVFEGVNAAMYSSEALCRLDQMPEHQTISAAKHFVAHIERNAPALGVELKLNR